VPTAQAQVSNPATWLKQVDQFYYI